MELLVILASIGLIVFVLNQYVLPFNYLKKIDQQSINDDRYCVIDVRDYVSAHRSPFPSAENIPLSYLPRALKERFDCSKEIVLVSDDVRGARIAAKIMRKKKFKSIYYTRAC
ncbi:rhodanese-like domain-containing protein [Pontibacillus sp. HMF3514]|uniref:rhodanese-like domain-containing protein n=1 Tax=Pontibacillus sp. HMF3514 TaxID=2692425 RepID=UPI001F3B7527|nr:rhodanese-like domain-containing protein [Pontibacillus sp. HMF3514]